MQRNLTALILATIVVGGCGGNDPFGTAAPSSEQSQTGSAVPPPPPPPPANTVQEKAQPGVTGKGQYGGGLITTPIAAYFSTGERIVFNIQIPHTLKTYTALHGPPKTHEEFMEKVIKGIALPELPQDHRYVFDPKTQQLMVEHPE
jgi:hypothetical protein